MNLEELEQEKAKCQLHLEQLHIYEPSEEWYKMRREELDFSTGKVLDYDVQGVEVLLMKDPELYDEFEALKNKKKKQMKFLYIRKFNERNPLYIPENK